MITLITLILLFSLLVALFVNGLYIISSEGMILYPIRNLLYSVFGEDSTILKPIITCPPCMVSFWGVVLYFAIFGASIIPLPYLIISLFIASFISYLLTNLY